MHRSVLVALALLASLVPLSPCAAQVAATASPRIDATSVPPPVFTDPQRRARLAVAFPEIDRIVAAMAQQTRRPGAVLGVVIDGELAHVATAGVQDLGTNGAVTADSVFRIASMTKSFTAMAILILRDESKLSLDDPVEKHVPELATLRYPTSDSPKITVRHLLSHAEGFPEDNPWGDRQLSRTDAWLAEAIRAGIPFSTVPGTAFEYSNYGFGILGRVVQNVAKEPYDRFVERRVLAPLGMTSTTFDVATVDPARRAQGYRLVDGKHEAEDLLPHGAFGAMGGLWTSTRDLAKYVAFLMSAYPARDGADPGPLRRSSLREMQAVAWHDVTRARRAEIGGPLQLASGGYGFGLRITDDCSLGQSVSHGGGLPGYGSLMRWYAERGVGLVAMANLTYAGWSNTFNEAFEALKRTGALAARTVVPSPTLLQVQRDVTALIQRWDDTAAERLAADNLFLDQSLARRRAHVATLIERHGACRPGGKIEAENALRGTWQMPCDRGRLDVSITLAPTMPPRVQMLGVRGVLPPGAPLQQAIDAVLSLLREWDSTRASTVAGPTLDVDQTARQFQLAKLQVGTCRQGDTIAGDGTRALVALECERGRLMADVVLDETGTKVSTIRLVPHYAETCVP
jgi:CubicO group peptidase (beta-lactamase class C family)